MTFNYVICYLAIFLGKGSGFIPSWGSILPFSCYIVLNGTFCSDWTPAYPDFDALMNTWTQNALLQNYPTICFKPWFSFCCPWSLALSGFSWLLLPPPILCPCDPWHHSATWWDPEPCYKDEYFIIFKSFLDKDSCLVPPWGSALHSWCLLSWLMPIQPLMWVLSPFLSLLWTRNLLLFCSQSMSVPFSRTKSPCTPNPVLVSAVPGYWLGQTFPNSSYLCPFGTWHHSATWWDQEPYVKILV